MAQTVKRLPTMQETRIQSLGREDLLEKGMATHSSILAPPTKRNTHTHTHIYMCGMDVLVNLMGGILSQLYGHQVAMMYTLFIYWQNCVA